MSFEEPPRVPYVRLRPVAQGMALGTVMALAVFVATNWLIVKGGEAVGKHLSLLSQYFVGYSVTFGGSWVGAAYAFVLGFGVGYINAAVYNAFVDRREPDR